MCDPRPMPRRTEDLPEAYAAYTRALTQAIGGRVRTRRQQLHLSQEQVRTRMQVESVYVSRAQFSRIELGASLPNAAEIVALVKVLQVSYGWLLTADDEAGTYGS